MSETSTPNSSTTNAGDPGTIARLASQRTAFRQQRDAARGELEQLRAKVTQLETQNAGLATRADTSAAAKRVQELEARIREIGHRKVFDRMARDKGVPEDSLDLVYQTSGYKADGEPDEAAIGTIIDEQRAKPGISRLFGAAAAPKPGDPPPVKPGPGSGQGPSHILGAPLLQDDPRLNDPKWVMSNWGSIAEAAKGRVERGEV